MKQLEEIKAKYIYGLVSNNTAAAAWMVIKCLVFSIISVLSSKVSKHIHAYQIFFITMCVRLLLLTPLLMLQKKENALKINFPKLYVLRAILTMLSVITWFYVLKIMPVVDATAITYAAPIFTVVIASIVLKEKITFDRIISITVGLVGVMVILRPGIKETELGAFLALLTAIIWAISDITNKLQAHTEHLIVQTFFYTFLMTIFSLPLAIYVWQTPTTEQWVLLFIIGILFLFNHLSLILSYRNADLVVITPFSYSRLIFTGIISFFFLKEPQDIWNFIGAIIIVASNIYLLYKESHKLTKVKSNNH